tara:strand:- start:10170 stop:11273 length:1104 start_codon:yes stop_codon:yes gene_type:complete
MHISRPILGHTHKRRVIKRYLAAAACLLILQGCSDTSGLEASWQDYLSRLSRVLDRDISRDPSGEVLHFPRTRDIAMTFAPSNIDILDFLRMRRCALRETIAQRNSILGRHGDESAKLLFDLRFLNEARECIQLLKDDGNDSLASQLSDAARLKQQELPKRIFAAGIAGDEFREFWKMPPDLRDYPSSGEDPSIAALARWQRWQHQWLAGNWEHDANDVLTTLGHIRMGGGGSLLKAEELNTRELRAAAKLIDQRISGRALCLKPSPTSSAQQFRNVLGSRFIGVIQQQASLINQHKYGLLNNIDTIENELFSAMAAQDAEVPQAYLNWLSQRTALLANATKAHQRHVKLAGELLSQCGLSPGGNSP